MRSILVSIWVCHILLVYTGCGFADHDPSLIPVAGLVTVAGKPAARGSVSFHEASGTTGHTPIGMIAQDGTYQLFVNGQPGAMPGAYKVTLFIHEPAKPAAGHSGLPQSLIDPKYSHKDRTPFFVEVNTDRAADRYDLAIP